MVSPLPIEIDIISDVMCPWCFIGKRRLESALKQRADLEVDVRWHPFQLDATIPPGGMDRQEYLNRKFGGPAGAAGVYENIKLAGQQENIAFAFDKIGRSPNTIDCHRLIHWAKNEGCQDGVVERLFDLFFIKGEDIGDHTVLLKAAEGAGMDVDKVRGMLESDVDRDTIEQGVAYAHKIGVEGVPCFIIGGKYAMSGAQNPDSILQVLDKVAEENTNQSSLEP